MSVALTNWAWSQAGLTPTEKLVLLALAWNSAPDVAHCTVGNRRIMELTRLSDRAVRKALHALGARGLIGIDHRRDPGGARLPNLYSLRCA